MNVVITGATKGIGLAIAKKFAAAGCSLAVCARSEEDLEKLKKEFLMRFPQILIKTKVTDISDANSIKDFGKWILDSGFTPDVLINNAGFFAAGNIYSEKEEMLQKMLNTNLAGAYHLTRLLLPDMIKKKSGHIFNICSVASLKPEANSGSYGISKYALYGFTQLLREEMKPYSIKVTAVLPGATYTASWEDSDVDPGHLLQAGDVAEMVFTCTQLSPTAVVEDIVLRPQPGDR